MFKPRKNIIYLLVSIFMISTALLFFLDMQRQSKEPEYVFTYAENHPEDYPTTLGAMKFAELVEAQTGGRIRILVQAGGELGDEKAVIDQVEFGGVDFTRVSLSPLADSIPKLNVLQLPYLYRDSTHMWKVLDGKIGDEFLASFEETDMVGLSWYDAGARCFYNTQKPITCLADMKGMKIRVQESEMMVDMVKALGAVAEPLAYGDVYSGLETGVIDGAENNWPSYESQGHYEVAKYFTVDEHTRVPEVQMCSRATWNKLSKEDQTIILTCAKESALYERELWVAREKESEQIVIDSGVQVTTLTPKAKEEFIDAVKGIYELYCADYMDIIQRIRNT